MQAPLAASELAWREAGLAARHGLTSAATVTLVRLLGTLSSVGIVAAAHDLSVGGLGVALARMAIAAGCGAQVALPDVAGDPTAALFGERVGRAILSVAPSDASRLIDACQDAGVPVMRLGMAGGGELLISLPGASLALALDSLRAAWETPF